MKALFLSVMVAVASAAMINCAGGTEKSVQTEETTISSKIKNASNPDSLKVYVDQAKEYAQKLIKEGKAKEAQEFLDKITPVVQEKAPALTGTLETVKSALEKLPGTAASDAKGALDDAKAEGQEAVDKAKDAAGDAVQGVKDKATEARDKAQQKVDEAKDKAQQKADEAKDKAREKADEAKEKARNAVNNLFE